MTSSSTLPTIGVVGAGRVGASLAAALRAAGYPIVAVAGESAASRTRIETLLPGVPVEKPTAVARSCDVLLLTVPDDVLDNVVRMLVGPGAIRAGQVVVHTSGRHGLGVLEPVTAVGGRAVAMHPAMTFTGTDVDLQRLPGWVYGVTAAPAEHVLVEALVEALRGSVMWVAEQDRIQYHTALAHGANHLVTLVGQAVDLLRAAGATDPSAVLRPLLTAALDNALDYGDAALTGPIVRGDVATVSAHLQVLAAVAPQTLDSYLALAEATARRALADQALEPRRAAALLQVLEDARSRSVG